MPADKDNYSNKYSHLSSKAREDLKLINRAQAGDQTAYEELLKKYQRPLYATVFKVVKVKDIAEDIVLETFAKVFMHLKDYDPNFAFSTWLFRIGINKAIDHLRYKKNMNKLSIDEYMAEESGSTFAAQLSSSVNDPIQDLLKEENNAFVRHLLDKLSPRYKKVIDLFYYKDMSCDEIAQELNTATNNVKAELFRARKVLYRILTSRQKDN